MGVKDDCEDPARVTIEPVKMFSVHYMAGMGLVCGLIAPASGCGSDPDDGGSGSGGATTSLGTATGTETNSTTTGASTQGAGTDSSTTSAASTTDGSGGATGGTGTTSATGDSQGGASTTATTAGATSSTGTGASSGTGGSTTTTEGGGGSASVTTGGGGAPCLEFGEPEAVGTIENSGLPGASGLAASRVHPGVLYAHADAGSPAEFFAFDETGAELGSYTLAGASTTDWEDIAVGPTAAGSAIYLADIGDNAARMGGNGRTEIQVVRLAEPNVSPDQSPTSESLDGWDVLRFTYPDQAHDAETLLVDPVTGDLVLVTKEVDGNSLVFRAPGDTPTDTPTELEAIGSYQFSGSGQALQASAGDVSPSGDRIIIRTYQAIYLWQRAAGAGLGPTFATEPVTIPSPTQPQGEGLAFSSDGRAWFAAGEQEKTLYRGNASCP